MPPTRNRVFSCNLCPKENSMLENLVTYPSSIMHLKAPLHNPLSIGEIQDPACIHVVYTTRGKPTIRIPASSLCSNPGIGFFRW